jgi:hypothetical protein
MSATAETRARIVSAASLLVPGADALGAADPACCSAAAIEALSGVAGPGSGMTSLTLDVASAKLGAGEISIRAQVDKRTWSIVFASAEAWQGEQLVFSAQALFSKREGK